MINRKEHENLKVEIWTNIYPNNKANSSGFMKSWCVTKLYFGIKERDEKEREKKEREQILLCW